MELNHIETIFDGYGYLIPAISTAVANLETFQYRFMTEQSYRKLIEESPDPYEAQQVYCFEILERAHIAAVTSLIRADRWLKGVLNAFRDNNFFVFTSSFRGFLESCADTHYVLAAVPRTISDTSEQLYECLHRVPRSEIYIFQPLEDRLIHYSHGRKVGKTELTPDSHKAKTMKDYLTYLQQESNGPIHDFYSELCEVTHPAADSVWCMLTGLDESTIVLNKKFDREAIISMCRQNATSLDWLFGQCISPALMTLGLINLMNIKELQTSAIDHVDLSNVGRWNEISQKVTSVFAVH